MVVPEHHPSDVDGSSPAVVEIQERSLFGFPFGTDKWKNWAGNQKCYPEHIFHPKSLQDLKDIVLKAKRKNKKVRCAGSGHSWSTVSVTDDYLVIINNLDKVLGARKLSEDEIATATEVIGRPAVSDISREPLPGSGQGNKKRDVWAVTFENGILVKQLDDWLRNHDPPLTLPSNVVLDSVRYGGVLSMGCVTIVDANGELQTFSATDKSRADEFSAACVNLGLLGLVYSFTLRCEPMDFQLHGVDDFPLMTEYIPLPTQPGINNTSFLIAPTSTSATTTNEDHGESTETSEQAADIEAGQRLRAIVLGNDQSEFFYWPFNTSGLGAMNDKIWIKQWKRTLNPVTKSAHREGFEEILQTLTTEFGSKLYEFMVLFPESTPFFQCMMASIAGQKGEKVQTVPDAIHFQAGIDNIKCLDLEMAFKVDDGFVNVVRAWRYVVEQVYAYAEKKQFPLNLTMEMRFVKSSSALMANAYDDDPDAIYCMIEILSIKGTRGFDEFSNNIAQYWIKNFDAKPHWAKMWEHIDGIEEYLLRTTGDRLQKFEAIRRKYDPDGMFMNKTFAKLLGH
ncbi:hypothetical protein BGW41_004834 [Actinomortierella wolfii]|nr:hypothetical protein BGW41_004834 [Actinomortierella wolfii]